MTSRYRVEYALKSHRRDEFIEWIKGLLAPTFVLHTDLENDDTPLGSPKEFNEHEEHLLLRENLLAADCQKRYEEIFKDVENLIANCIRVDELSCPSDPGPVSRCRLRQLVPSLGRFFTPLPLAEAFLIEDGRRLISMRRFVSPSFNDVRVILNTAQILELGKIYRTRRGEGGGLKLITFDGDVTLYEDGSSIMADSPAVSRIIKLLSMNLFIGIVTAAGYPGELGSEKYYERLKGLIDEIKVTPELTDNQKNNFLIMGGESNYLFRFDTKAGCLKFIRASEWHLPKIKSWDQESIQYIVDVAEKHLIHLQNKFGIQDPSKTCIIRKERSVGIIPVNGFKILREHLEEIVLSCSSRLAELHLNMKREQSCDLSEKDNIKFCAFNGGSDVWVDIGDKSLGVESLQRYLCTSSNDYSHICPILKSETLHVGDQFASLGANDFKARLSACTAWITNPSETVDLLDFLIQNINASSIV